MDADSPAPAAAEAGKETGDKPVDATAVADVVAANGAPPPKEKKTFPRCQLRLRLDSGCFLARIAKEGDKGKQDDEKEEEKANGDVAPVEASTTDDDGANLLLPQELAAERGWLTDEHAAALERKLVEAASRLGNAAPPLWSLRSERVSREFFVLTSSSTAFRFGRRKGRLPTTEIAHYRGRFA